MPSGEVENEVRSHFHRQTLQTVIPRSVRVSEGTKLWAERRTYDPNVCQILAYPQAAPRAEPSSGEVIFAFVL